MYQVMKQHLTVAYELGVRVTSWCDGKDHSQEFENSKPVKGISNNIQKASVLVTYHTVRKFFILQESCIYLCNTRGRK